VQRPILRCLWGYTDAPTELVKISPNDSSAVGAAPLTDGTTLWRVTHNGVDSHAIHFHLFHVQIVNRVGWDGTIRPTEPNELGWKDTVRMNPLEDVVVALRPKVMTTLPFKVPNSHRLLDPAQAPGGGNGFYNLDPTTGNASSVTNVNVNYGWEYIWHCHILGHEENDMMRTIAVAQTPETPTAVTATGATAVTVNWIDNSIISNWVTIQRSLDGVTNSDGSFTTVNATFNVQEPECAVQAGCARSYVDSTAPALTSVYYRVMANNTAGAGDVRGALPVTLLPSVANGTVTPLTPGLAGYDNVTAESVWSGSAARLAVPVAGVNNVSLTFAGQLVNSTSAAQTVTVSNTGGGNLTFPTIATVGTNYAISANTCTTVAPSGNCSISVTFKPTLAGTLSGTLTIPTNDASHNPLVVSLTGIGTAPIAGLSPTTLPSFGNVNAGVTSTAQTVILSNTGSAPLTIASIVAPVQFAQTNNCPASLAANANCTVSVTFKPTAASPTPANLTTGNLVVTDNSGGVAGSTQTVALSGTGVAATTLNTPTALTSTVAGTTVTLRWVDNSISETGYVVQRAPVTITAAGVQTIGTFATITTPTGNLAANSSTVVNTGATAGLYAYQVYAVNGATNGPAATVYAWTGAAMSTPATPTASAAGNRTANSINVAWTASTPATNDITGYVVQRCTGSTYTGAAPTALQQVLGGVGCAFGGTFTTVTTTTAGSAGVAYNNTGLTGKTMYVYRVAATNALTGVISTNSATRLLWTN